MKTKGVLTKTLLAFCTVCILILTASPSIAEKIKVNSTDDVIANDGKCTLREAIIAANTDTASGAKRGECIAGSGTDKIVLKDEVYFLKLLGIGEDNSLTGDLDILSNLTIAGKGAKTTFINALQIDRVFHVIGNVKVKFKGITIQNGKSDIGGGIYNDGGTLKITYSDVSNNTAQGASYPKGGGIYSWGTLNINDSEISNNTASGISPWAGGIDNYGTLTISSSKVSNNMASGTSYGSAGGISNNGTLTISDSEVSGNTSSGVACDGGGITNFDTLTVSNSVISNNSASGTSSGYGGGIYNEGIATISDSDVSNNSASGASQGYGGGIENEGTVTISNTDVYSNMALGTSDTGFGHGGGIYNNAGVFTATDRSRIFGNLATEYGGGIYGTADISSNSQVVMNTPNNM